MYSIGCWLFLVHNRGIGIIARENLHKRMQGVRAGVSGTRHWIPSFSLSLQGLFWTVRTE